MTGQPRLIRIVGVRVLAFALVAMALQATLVFLEYWRDNDGLIRRIIELETQRIAASVQDGTTLTVTPTIAERYAKVLTTGDTGSIPDATRSDMKGYYLRIRNLTRGLVYSTCEGACLNLLMPEGFTPPAFWQRSLRPGKPLSFAGGQSFESSNGVFHIELIVVDDPDGLTNVVIVDELLDHMLLPMTLMLTLVFGATVWSVRRALKPVSAAAKTVGNLDLAFRPGPIALDGMPFEIASFGSAVNRAIQRISDLIQAQKVYTAAIAHEIRTPIAVIRLELETCDDPRARNALNDLASLTYVLEQLTSLARLDGMVEQTFETVSLRHVAETAVAAMAPLVYEFGKVISLEAMGDPQVRAIPSLLELLIRNLVENAIRHTEEGTEITVSVRAVGVLEVANSLPGNRPRPGDGKSPPPDGSASGARLGSQIVDRIAQLHGAVVLRHEGPAGFLVQVCFPSSPQGTIPTQFAATPGASKSIS
ncbi:ATP-binding protein [Chthonobacter albigriseus]|uniref:ATP-binding protein n=1 Tax=Chthonobacter albigriseus TaxID=1683161 RepID=UPI0015EF4818|nr:ATP-binding protein [Chthonobacter albigriseus]